jgi:hypothetical protein
LKIIWIKESKNIINRATPSTVCEVSAGVQQRSALVTFAIFNLYK